MPGRNRVQDLAAAVLGIKIAQSNNARLDPASCNESVFSTDTLFVEDEPTVAEWCRSLLPSRRQLPAYVRQLFPFTEWIGRYNLQWLYGDLVAGEI